MIEFSIKRFSTPCVCTLSVNRFFNHALVLSVVEAEMSLPDKILGLYLYLYHICSFHMQYLSMRIMLQ